MISNNSTENKNMIGQLIKLFSGVAHWASFIFFIFFQFNSQLYLHSIQFMVGIRTHNHESSALNNKSWLLALINLT